MEYKPLSREELLKQGYCCGSECTNCPYEPKHKKDSTKINKFI